MICITNWTTHNHWVQKWINTNHLAQKGEKFDLMIKTATEYIEGTCMIYILSALKT
jgi:hypothetical protein